MFHHVVLMKFSAKVDKSFFDAVESFCEEIRRSADPPIRYVFGGNGASRSDGLDFAIVSSFSSAAAHDTYQASPVHQEMKAYMSSYIERIVVCDVDESTQ